MTWLRPRRPSASMVVALIALVVAMGGTSYAAINLPANSVGSKQLKKNAVTTKKIKKGAVTAAKINTAGLTVPNAQHANSADSAKSAQNATSAGDASKLGGKSPSAYALSAQPGFTKATLNSGYSQYSGGSVPGYYKDSLGYVHLSGMMNCPFYGTAFTLPAGYRPAAQLFMPMAWGVSGAGNLLVGTNGNLVTYSADGAGHACGIDGLVFKAG